jgi:hypothetical protein
MSTVPSACALVCTELRVKRLNECELFMMINVVALPDYWQLIWFTGTSSPHATQL